MTLETLIKEEMLSMQRDITYLIKQVQQLAKNQTKIAHELNKIARPAPLDEEIDKANAEASMTEEAKQQEQEEREQEIVPDVHASRL